ncbi:MAG: DUF411 domain-containing protein, partial [Chloroflexi bacterium]|nr:DUF411 domain-containing protein [Chloroflexota bacterium]
MKDSGFKVQVQWLEDMKPVKQRFGVPERVEGCHTAVIGGYVIEGHVPVEAIG